MQEFIETFHIDWKIMLAQIVNFGLVFLALYVLAAKPLRKVIKERGEEISKGLEDAKINAELKKKAEAEYEEAMTRARKDTQAMHDEAKKDIEKARAEAVEKTKADTDAVVLAGKKSLEAEKIKMVEDAKREVASLVISATEKVLREKN